MAGDRADLVVCESHDCGPHEIDASCHNVAHPNCLGNVLNCCWAPDSCGTVGL